MFYFRLLKGWFTVGSGKNAKTYKVETIRDEKTQAITEVIHPVVLFAGNLVKTSPKGKFVQISKDEAERLLEIEKARVAVTPPDTTLPQSPVVKPEVPVQTSVEQAVQQGAKDILQPAEGLEAAQRKLAAILEGKDVSEKFEEAETAGLQVFYKPAGQYFVVEKTSRTLLNTEGSLKKTEVDEFIDKFLET